MPAVIILAEPDPRWAEQYRAQEDGIRTALGPIAHTVEHVGSTSVPGLAAKPILDILLVVPDATDEPSYVPALERAGYAFFLREPLWHEHRLLKGTEPWVNLHVFPIGSAEIERMLLFRDRLRGHPAERRLYEDTKRRLSMQEWESVQDYADAKTEVVEAIIRRAREGLG
ncbi:MAG: GrpB family protein [Actinobacteria bacterium]|jgi:GrpB-like predicted nucleotidyltransferase (UPF0157 family)|nr:GrpB family protein [Actinomycetota bacterium]